MSPCKFYLRTRDESDELTHFYKIEAFPPAADVRADVTGEPGMTDAELAALKRRSVDRYGTVPESPEEQKAQSHFYGNGPGDAGNGAGDLAVTDAVEHAVAHGAYDAACRTGDSDGFVLPRRRPRADRTPRARSGGDACPRRRRRTCSPSRATCGGGSSNTPPTTSLTSASRTAHPRSGRRPRGRRSRRSARIKAPAARATVCSCGTPTRR